MAKAVLVRYGELALKGKNRINFENKLSDNIKKAVKCGVKKISGRFIVYLKDNKDFNDIRRVFGIISISLAEEIELDINEINKEALKQAKNKKFDTFRITVQRLQKKLKPSPELEREIGAYIVDKTGKKVKLKNPDLGIFIEIAEKAYVFTEKARCFGGLPTGIEGKVAVFFDEKTKADKSVLAGLLMMRRGCDVFPFLTKRTDIALLREYGSKKPLFVKNIKEMEKEAKKKECRAIAVGYTLKEIKDLDTSLVVLMPLVNFTEKGINEKLIDFKK